MQFQLSLSLTNTQQGMEVLSVIRSTRSSPLILDAISISKQKIYRLTQLILTFPF